MSASPAVTIRRIRAVWPQQRAYLLELVVEATRYVETQQKTGNVVLRVESLMDGHG
jgi:hypothetical protein